MVSFPEGVLVSGVRIYDELVEAGKEFLRTYYHESVLELATMYPSESNLTVEWGDLYQYEAELADEYLDDPEEIRANLETALAEYDHPVNADLEDATIRVVGLYDGEVLDPLELTKTDPDGYVGVRGVLAKVTAPAKILTTAAYRCVRCNTVTEVVQNGGTQEPHECGGCERQGPFAVDYDRSEYEHYCKVRIETPPDERGDLQAQHVDGFVRGDLVWTGHDEHGLVARTGDDVTVYGTVERRPRDGDDPIFDEYLDVDAVEFHDDGDDVEIEAHRAHFEDLADRADAVDLFAESIAPELYATPAWDRALELLVAYLFGAPRIDVPDGPTFRGDIHALIVSDYGMGKSMVNENVALYSPDCIKESATGLSSDVGLLAAAVKDDFGEDQWTLKPGILVRANGGHVVLDEIDKTDADLERMNDALEGEQVVDVNKAGQSATYNSRVGLLATGNPQDARFDANTPVSDQLGIGQSLLSRFDGIVTMSDAPDEETDANVAETQGMAYVEAQEYVHGDRDELDRLERTVPVEVGRAWIAHARENANPLISPEQVARIKEWYAEEVRQLNENFGDPQAGGDDMPVPVTARVVAATIRFSVAFARVHLREEVRDADVERAMDLAKSLVGQNFDGEKFHPQEMRGSDVTTQQERYDAVLDVLADGPLDREAVVERCADRGIAERDVEHAVEKLKQQGEAYEPEPGVVDAT